jgi:hypothetical protein
MIAAQTFDALGQRWTLLLNNAAQCAVEEQYDKGFFAVIADAMPNLDPVTAAAVARSMSDGADLSPEVAFRAVEAMKGMRMSLLRDLAWHGLRRNHPGISLDDVSDIIDDLGQGPFGDIIGKAIRAAQGVEAAEDGAAGERKPARTPQKKRTGTGS